MKRPARLDLSVRWEAAKALSAHLPAGTFADDPETRRQALLDLARVLNDDLNDPYAMTQTLEKVHGWQGSMALLNALQQAPTALNNAHRAATEQWVIAHQVTPRFEVGKRVTMADPKDPNIQHEGEVAQIETDLAVYLIHVPGLGHTRDAATGEVQGIRFAFEDCHPIGDEAEAPAAQSTAEAASKDTPDTAPEPDPATEGSASTAEHGEQQNQQKPSRRRRREAAEPPKLTMSHIWFVVSLGVVSFLLALGLMFWVFGEETSASGIWEFTVDVMGQDAEMRGHTVDMALFIVVPLLVILAIFAKWLPNLNTLKWMTRSGLAGVALMGSAALMNPALDQNKAYAQGEEQQSEDSSKSKKKKSASKGSGLDLGSAVAGAATAKTASGDESSADTTRRKKKRR